MTILTVEKECLVTGVSFSKDSFCVSLDDGRTVTVPLTWYPRLLNATAKARSKCRLIGDGEGVHWPELDEDISVEGILAGRRSCEVRRP